MKTKAFFLALALLVISLQSCEKAEIRNLGFDLTVYNLTPYKGEIIVQGSGTVPSIAANDTLHYTNAELLHLDWYDRKYYARLYDSTGYPVAETKWQYMNCPYIYIELPN